MGRLRGLSRQRGVPLARRRRVEEVYLRVRNSGVRFKEVSGKLEAKLRLQVTVVDSTGKTVASQKEEFRFTTTEPEEASSPLRFNTIIKRFGLDAGQVPSLLSCRGPLRAEDVGGRSHQGQAQIGSDFRLPADRSGLSGRSDVGERREVSLGDRSSVPGTRVRSQPAAALRPLSRLAPRVRRVVRPGFSGRVRRSPLRDGGSRRERRESEKGESAASQARLGRAGRARHLPPRDSRGSQHARRGKLHALPQRGSRGGD